MTHATLKNPGAMRIAASKPECPTAAPSESKLRHFGHCRLLHPPRMHWWGHDASMEQFYPFLFEIGLLLKGCWLDLEVAVTTQGPIWPPTVSNVCVGHVVERHIFMIK